MSGEQYAFAIDVPVRNDWSNVGLLVTSVQNCFNAMFANVEGSRIVAMVTGELLENAIKYGAWQSESQPLRLNVRGGNNTACVTVENPADLKNFDELQRSLNWMDGFPDAESAFRARLLALAQTTDPDVSKLGVVRIAYEGNCSIVAELVDGLVRVTAEIRF